MPRRDRIHRPPAGRELLPDKGTVGDQYAKAVDRALAELWRLRAGKRVTAAAPDDSVSVTVDGNGTVLAIDLARRPSRWPSLADCGAAIRDTVNAARSTAAHRSEQLVDRTLRADPELAAFGFSGEDA